MPNARPAQELPHLGRNTQQSLSKVLAPPPLDYEIVHFMVLFAGPIRKYATTKNPPQKKALWKKKNFQYLSSGHRKLSTEIAPKKAFFCTIRRSREKVPKIAPEMEKFCVLFLFQDLHWLFYEYHWWWWWRTTWSCRHKAWAKTNRQRPEAQSCLILEEQESWQNEGVCTTLGVTPEIIPSQGGWCPWFRIKCCVAAAALSNSYANCWGGITNG